MSNNDDRTTLPSDYIKGKDGKLHKRVKTGYWRPVFTGWMSQELWCAVRAMHQFKHENMSKGLRDASLGEEIFGKEGPRHKGYGTGALQKWADKMVSEGKDPHYVNLLDWFKGASAALDYHMCERTFDELMEESRHDPCHMMRYIIERMQDCMPQLRNMSRARMNETIKQKYYTIRYASC